MNSLICAGGSGSRVLEAMIHLCSVGLGPPTLRVLMIDPDGGNGNVSRVKNLISTYESIKRNIRVPGDTSRYFRTNLDLLDATGGGEGLKVWSPVTPGTKLLDVLNYDNLSSHDQDVVRLFFSSDEQQMNLDQGFRGHPSIGAATMAMISKQANRAPWHELTTKIRTDLGQEAGSSVFMACSVFGGTGASVIHPLVRYLRKIAIQNPDRLRIGLVALVPYFRFESAQAGAEAAAKAEWFALAAKSAAQYYEHLRKSGDWEFQAMYWIGDDTPIPVNYAPGGPLQQNPAHFVDLLSGLAGMDFFEKPAVSKACYYSGPGKAPVEEEDRNIVDWDTLPFRALKTRNVRHGLLQFTISAVAHSAFLSNLLQHHDLDARAHCTPWYYDRFTKRDDSLSVPEAREALRVLNRYFEEFYFPWWRDVLSVDGVRLLNSTAFQGEESTAAADLLRLKNLLGRDDSRLVSRVPFDRFFTDLCQLAVESGSGRGAAAYMDLLERTSHAFMVREYGENA